MKIAISLKSNFAFERLEVAFIQFKELREVERHKKNLQTVDDLDDCLEFFQPDLLILDTKLPNINEMSGFAKERNTSIVYFQADVDSTMQEVIEFFSLNEVEEEDVQQKNIEYIPQLKPKTEVVFKDRVVEKEIIKTSYTSIPSKLIVVASMWQGAGSTTLATNLARAIANRGIKVSYVEFPLSKPYMFDYLQIPKQELEREQTYFDFSKELKDKKLIRRKVEAWNQFDVDWYVTDTRNEPITKFSYEELIKLIYSINSTITIVDVAANLHHESVQNFLHHADDIFICIEPDPIKIDWLASININGTESTQQRQEKKIIDYLNEIQEVENVAYQFVNMKYTKKIDNKTWLECLDKKPLTYVPVIDYHDYISSVWNSNFVYDSIEYQEVLEKAFKPLIVKMLPRKFVELENQNNNSKFKNLFNVFKRGEN